MPLLSLEHHRKRARALLKDVRAHRPDAVARFRGSDSVAASTMRPSLHHAQLVVARESGFASWARLKQHVRTQCLARPLMRAALVDAANRALETGLAHPLYRDPFARALAGDAGMSLLASMRRAAWPGYSTGPDPYLTILTRFFDDVLQQIVSRAGIRQIVLIGAGMDTRAWRLEWPDDVTIFEIDGVDVFEHKEHVFRTLRARPTCRRCIVKTTLGASWGRRLVRQGFDGDQAAAFHIGRLQFLDPVVVDRILHEVGALASRGSWIGCAVMSEATRLSWFMTPYLRKMDRLGLPSWRFGVDDPDLWLRSYGWNAHSVVTGDPDVSYGRWPYGHVARGTPAIPRGFLTQGWKSAKEEPWPRSR